MSIFERPRGSGSWVAKFQLNGAQVWVPDGPWASKSAAREAERRYRDRLAARVTDESCASFAERWLLEWPRASESTNRLYARAVRRFAEDFGPTLLGEVERLSARTWALAVPRSVSRVIGTMYEDARNVGLVDSNPFANLRLPMVEKQPEIEPPTIEEYRALLEACTVLGGYCSEMRAMITFAAWTGLRQGELFALQWQDVAEEETRSVVLGSSTGRWARPRTVGSGRCHCSRPPGCSTRCRAGSTPRSYSTHPAASR